MKSPKPLHVMEFTFQYLHSCVFTDMPYSKPLENNVACVPITEPCDANYVKINHGSQQSDWTLATS